MKGSVHSHTFALITEQSWNDKPRKNNHVGTEKCTDFRNFVAMVFVKRIRGDLYPEIGVGFVYATSKASVEQLNEARAHLIPLVLFKTRNESRMLLVGARGLHALSLKDSGREAIVSTKGLLEAMVGVLNIWVEEEVLQKSADQNRQQLTPGRTTRTHSRDAHPTLLLCSSLELLESLCHLAKHENYCKVALMRAKCHSILLSIVTSSASPFNFRLISASGLRGMSDAVACRNTLQDDESVPTFVGVLESLSQNHDADATSLKLEMLAIITCLLDSAKGTRQVLQHGLSVLSNILLSSRSSPLHSTLQLAAAAAMALLVEGGCDAEYHIMRQGPAILVHTADVRTRIDAASCVCVYDVC